MSYVNENFRKVLDNLSAVTEKLGFAAYKDENGEFITEKDGVVSARYTGEKGVIEGLEKKVGYLETRNIKMKAIKEAVKAKMELFGCVGKA